MDRRTMRIGIRRSAGPEYARIRDIETRILQVSENGLTVAGKLAAQDRLVDEVHSKAHCVTPRGSRNVVAELVFLLVALNGERGNGGGKLIVAEGLKAGSREEAHGEGKSQRLARSEERRVGKECRSRWWACGTR